MQRRKSARTPTKPTRFSPEEEAAKPQFASNSVATEEEDDSSSKSAPSPSVRKTGKAAAAGGGGGTNAVPIADEFDFELLPPYKASFPFIAINRGQDEGFLSYCCKLTLLTPFYIAAYTVLLYGLQLAVTGTCCCTADFLCIFRVVRSTSRFSRNLQSHKATSAAVAGWCDVQNTPRRSSKWSPRH